VKRDIGHLVDMSKPCFYSFSTLSYKHQYASCCAFQTDQLIRFDDDLLPSKIHNHTGFRNIRKNLMNDKWPDGCLHCKISEEENSKSSRQDYLFNGIKFENEDDNFTFSFYDEKSGIIKNEGLKRIEIRMNNVCNMSCLHCSNGYSSKWNKIVNDYTPDVLDYELDISQLIEKNDQLGLTENQLIEIIQDVNRNFINLNRVILSGGEPLLNKSFFKVLDLLSEHKNSKNIRLTFYTNLNVGYDIDFDRLSKCLSKFGKTEIAISIDAGEKIYPYFRDGSWDKLNENIKNLKKTNNFSSLETSMSFSAFQLLDLKNIIKDILSLKLSEFRTGLVWTPKYLNPLVLMCRYRKELLYDFDNILSYLEKLPKTNLNNSIYYYLQNLKPRIFDIRSDEKNYKAFLRYIYKIDKIMNKNFNDYYDRFKIIDNELVKIYE